MQSLVGVLILLYLTIFQYTLAEKGTRRFEFNIQQASLNPDCFNTSYPSLTVNGQYLGPILRAVKNDKIEVLIKNDGDNNVSTSVHFHGIYQFGSNNADGVAGITQLPIAPGEEFLHSFQIINQTGTFYYHSHVGVQDDTVQGPFIVYESEESLLQAEKEMLSDGQEKIQEGPYKYDEERILQWSEWWHQSAYDRERFYLDPNFTGDDGPDSFLLNGRSVYSNISTESCPGFSVIDLKPNRVYRLRFIGALTFRMLGIMIPHHNMTLIELDGEYVKPLAVDHVELVPGRRMSVLIQTGNYADGSMFPIGSYFKYRLHGSGAFTRNGFGYIRYVSDKAHISHIKVAQKPTSLPAGTQNIVNGWVMHDLRPYYSGDPAILSAEPTHIIKLSMQRVILPDNTTRFKNNGRIHKPWGSKTESLLDQVRNDPDYGRPSTFDGFSEKHQTYPLQVGDIVDVVFQNMKGPNDDCVTHPWHTHGHSHYLLAEGAGEYNHELDKDVRTYVDPPFQDVSMQYAAPVDGIQPCGWTKIRLHLNNPGVWPVHCHITEHMIQGKIVVFEVSPKLLDDSIKDDPVEDDPVEDDLVEDDLVEDDLVEDDD
ncbi:hypothetical protein G6F57_001386 [Rhizopus arrhizus]|uniref:Uncharacterized protein n=1 Tax=Rhizopus oryzae TaxID=64495 RepID=A0A9P7BWL0_RHIOR|nr:hypothetical protein G6F23_000053 [Rhizopus arrhizus]KAG1429169.1 hypothetical protein G6F58_000186 [Rhizopus delemar]KAG0781532.1 hypothetical protein G6F22_009524 [Rhizopus arrhizus]KAG0796249.1 hypothetical protein G6F21_001463 [Rhizopus arrhizus]KAG0817692.1 hypothetical protein G6F20_002180 [Rhizopus arrhizus]